MTMFHYMTFDEALRYVIMTLLTGGHDKCRDLRFSIFWGFGVPGVMWYIVDMVHPREFNSDFVNGNFEAIKALIKVQGGI